jgi:nucleoside-diphosphate-sugar epimerase
MRVLLTGASGFLGSHVLDRLRFAKIETVILGRCRPPHSEFADFIAADLLVDHELTKFIKQAKATHLLHLAWYANHVDFWSSPTNLPWVDSTIRLVEAFCLEGGQRVVFAGTCAEYDWSYGYCREDQTPLNPATLYGTAKDVARRMAVSICDKHSVTYAWGRIFLTFGSGEAKARLIPSLVDVFSGQRQPFSVNGKAYRDFLHVTDVANAFITLVNGRSSGMYNICSSQPVQLSNLVRELAQLMGKDPQTVLELSSARLGEPHLLVGENIKLRSEGWDPEFSLQQGLESTLREVNLHANN